MTLQELLFEVERLTVILPGETGLLAGVDYRTTLLNRGQRDFANLTRFLKDEYQFDSMVGQREYDFKTLFPNLIDLNHEGGVFFDGKLITEKSQARKNRDDGAWRDAGSGTPQEYHFKENKFFALHPIPNEVKTVTLNAIVWPNELFDFAEEPFNGHHAYEDYHWAPVYYALRELMKSDEKQSDKYDKLYMREVAKAMKLPMKQNNMSTKVLRPVVYNAMRGRRRAW